VNPVETATAVTDFPASRYDGFRNQSHAIYFQDYMNLHPKLQLLVSGRYDAYQHYNYRNPIVDGVETISPHTNVFSQDPFTYRVGLISQLFPFFSVYTSYSTSFTAQVALSTTGNELKPETGKQFEAGGRFKLFEDRLSLNVAWYRIVQKNVSVSRANGEIDQAGQQYSKGAEVELRSRINQKLNVYASYGFTQPAYDNFTGVSPIDFETLNEPSQVDSSSGTEAHRSNLDQRIRGLARRPLREQTRHRPVRHIFHARVCDVRRGLPLSARQIRLQH
jgi:outer membrane receptor protein involved in Fe transport